MPFTISVDTGGTFTDVIVSDKKGAMTIGKALTTRDRILRWNARGDLGGGRQFRYSFFVPAR